MTSRAVLAAVLLTTVSVARSAGAFEVKHADGGTLVRWERAQVEWTIDRSLREVPGGEDAVAGAIKAWTRRAGAPKLEISVTGADLAPGYDGKSVVFFVPGGYEPAGKALAITLLSFDERTGAVLDADIVLSGRYRFGPIDVGGKHEASDTYDVARVIAHEMGHALALSDEPANKEALMYPFVERARALRATPTSDDVAGLALLYGNAAATSDGPAASEAAPEAKSGGCSGSVVARTGPRSAPGSALAAGGLVIVALAMARSKRRGRGAAAGATVLAAGALVVLPPADSTRALPLATGASTVVTHVETTSYRGLFRSEVVVATGERSVMWGGTIDGVRQVVGGVDVPTAGDRVRVSFDAERGIHTFLRGGE